MSFSRQGIPNPQNGPGAQRTYAELIEEFLELENQLMRINASLETGRPDKHSKAFEKQFPSLKPNIGR